MTNSVKTKDRTNKQICISFGEDEIGLLEKWDEDRRREQITRSSWVKNRIRETLWVEYMTGKELSKTLKGWTLWLVELTMKEVKENLREWLELTIWGSIHSQTKLHLRFLIGITQNQQKICSHIIQKLWVRLWQHNHTRVRFIE